MNQNFFTLKEVLRVKDILKFLKITKATFKKYNCKFVDKIFEVQILDLTSFEDIKEDMLSFVIKKRDLKFVKNSICLVSTKDASLFPDTIIKIPVIDPRLSFSKIVNKYCERNKSYMNENKIINHSIISQSAKIGKNVKIGKFCIINNNVIIGDNVIIEDRVTIMDNCIINNGCVLKTGVYLECCQMEEEVIVSEYSVIGKGGFGFLPMKEKTNLFFHIGGVLIGKNTNIGSNCNIDRGLIKDTFIGRSVMIDNQVHIAHNCVIEDFCILAGKCALSGSVHLKKNVILGGDVGLVDNISIGEGSLIAAGSKVFKSFPEKSKIGGYPAQNLYDWQRIHVKNNQIIKKRKKYEY